LTSIIEKRQSLHKELAARQQENTSLKSQIRRLRALAGLGTATCMIAHEINNLLTPLSGYATFALNNPDDKALTEKALKKAAQNCTQAAKVMESILAVANGQTEKKESARLSVLLEEVFRCLCRDFAKDGITVEIRIPEELTIYAVPAQIQQVLMNLILNARDAMLAGGGVLTIEAQQSAEAVQIKVTDTGCGIEPGNLKKIFEPFFTTKADGNSPLVRTGCGLGLALCKKIIDEHRGSITAESKPAEGSTFTITLPKPP
jgi:two-component system NtrC family sensor kinase